MPDFAFRRWADPFVIPVGPGTASTQIIIKDDPKFPSIERGRSFIFVNPNPFCVRLRGSSLQRDGGFIAVTETTGWLIMPWEKSVWSTQQPDWVSAMSVTRGGLTAGTGTLELAYGTGS